METHFHSSLSLFHSLFLIPPIPSFQAHSPTMKFYHQRKVQKYSPHGCLLNLYNHYYYVYAYRIRNERWFRAWQTKPCIAMRSLAYVRSTCHMPIIFYHSDVWIYFFLFLFSCCYTYLSRAHRATDHHLIAMYELLNYHTE